MHRFPPLVEPLLSPSITGECIKSPPNCSVQQPRRRAPHITEDEQPALRQQYREGTLSIHPPPLRRVGLIIRAGDITAWAQVNAYAFAYARHQLGCLHPSCCGHVVITGFWVYTSIAVIYG
eukprot:9024930-Pyramimonas_sp.AAC.1